MSLNITPEMITELAEMAGDPHNAKILLTDQGWTVRYDVQNLYPVGLTAYTRYDLHELSEGDPIDADLAEQLATEGPHGSFAILTETPGDGDWQIVTPEIDENDQEPAWTAAWAFNLDTATEIVAQEPWQYYENGHAADRNQVTSLHLTEAGTWVMLTRSRWENDGDTWTEVTPAEAAEHAYHADPERIADNPPTLIAAAVKAAELAALITAPETPSNSDKRVAVGQAWRRRELAAETIRDGAVIADLIHEHVVADIKQQRAQAARVAVMAYGTQTAAAEELGMLQPRLNKLLNHDA